MALPPEQINIKRRREEEPVETLYPSTPSHPAAQRLLRSPRSVSSLHVNRRAPQPISSTGVPQVRATSPGAEIRAAQRRAAELKEAEEKRKRAIDKPIPQSSSTSTALTKSPSDAGQGGSNPVSGSESSTAATQSSRAASVRRFQISRTSSPAAVLGLRSASGIQKRRAEGSPGVAVLVEQLQRTQHSRKASMVADLVGQQANFNEKQDIAVNELAKDLSSTPVKPRKRPVVNQAEKKWREERKTAVSAAKQHLLSETLEKSAKAHSSQSWDEESERLAREFEKVALELENDMELDSHDELDVRSGPSPGPGSVTSPAGQPKVQASRTDYSQFASPAASSLKYQPRLPKEPRASASRPEEPAQNEVDDQAVDENDEDYVYDVYIRRPLAETDILTNPLAELESDQQMKDLEASRAGVGIIVITAEDEEYWENFIEDDEEEWDSEDADSNAENNPANDYPDEELSSSDEDDDPTAIYGKYRSHGVSDDEEFDIDDSGSENGARYGSAFGYRQRYGGHVDSDEESY